MTTTVNLSKTEIEAIIAAHLRKEGFNVTGPLKYAVTSAYYDPREHSSSESTLTGIVATVTRIEPRLSFTPSAGQLDGPVCPR